MSGYAFSGARGTMVFVLAAVVLTSGCAEQRRERLNAPPQGTAENHPRMAQVFAYHNDQGMLADMSIADIHFVPHSADLSGVGEARLERYAELLATSGGSIRYDTGLGDVKLITARLASAERFLREALPSTGTIEVATGLPGGRGMTVQESSAGKAVAEQPEPRQTAYYLNVSSGS
ncbi:MAG: hypothetical protein ABII12_14240 [Planctomycetota bacterium]